MSFIKVKFTFFTLIKTAVICLLLASCQEAKTDKQKVYSSPEKSKLQQVLVPATFTAASAQQLRVQIDSFFKNLQAKKGFNGTVLITKYDKILYKGAFGYADFSKQDTLTTQTAFQLASVSKQFTAMAVMMLKEQGKLHYDDSVQQYFPAFPYKDITIRQLLTHRSGLPNYTYFSDKYWPSRKVFITNDDVVNLMALHKPTVYYRPNTRFDYSNSGYCLLAAIVAKASGKSFATFMQEQIFEPLQMTHTFTYSDKILVLSKKPAIGYTHGKRKREADYLDTVLGDKGVYTTVEDLYKWDQALYTEKLVKQATLKEAFTGASRENKIEDYGFGWRIRLLACGEMVEYHAGLWHGFNTYFMRNRKDHSAVVVLSNWPNGSLKYVEDVQYILYPKQPVITVKNCSKRLKAVGAPR